MRVAIRRDVLGRECSRSMKKQSSAPSKSVMVAGAFVLLAGILFALAFYYFDGAQMGRGVIDGIVAAVQPPQELAPSPPPAEPTRAEALQLPTGMPESFALRIWQEQVDSQRTIERLVKGEVVSLRIADVSVRGDEAVLTAEMQMRDGATIPGAIGMRRFGNVWYVAYATADRTEADVAPKETPLPTLEEIDVPLLNTIVAEQAKSADITQEYVDGTVRRVNVGEVRPGPNSATIELQSKESSEYASADLIAVKGKAAGKELWFLVRFMKKGTTAPE